MCVSVYNECNNVSDKTEQIHVEGGCVDCMYRISARSVKGNVVFYKTWDYRICAEITGFYQCFWNG